MITFPSDLVEDTDYILELKITDPDGLLSDPDTVIVTAIPEVAVAISHAPLI